MTAMTFCSLWVPWCPDLPLRYRDLMAQDQDLGILGLVGPGKRGKPAEHAEHR
jgi:hypothetical protein